MAFVHCLALKSLQDEKQVDYNRSRINLLIERHDHELFKYIYIYFNPFFKLGEDEDPLLGNLEYMQDEAKLRYWCMAINFLVDENDVPIVMRIKCLAGHGSGLQAGISVFRKLRLLHPISLKISWAWQASFRASRSLLHTA